MKSMYDRIAAVSKELERAGQFGLVNELNDICDHIDTIDSILDDIVREKKPIKNLHAIRREMYGEVG